MQIFTWDGAFVLQLEMAHTALKVPGDCEIMHAQDQFLEEEPQFSNLVKFKTDLRRGQYMKHHKKVIRKCSALDSAPG